MPIPKRVTIKEYIKVSLKLVIISPHPS